MKPSSFCDSLLDTPVDIPAAALCFARGIAYPDLDVPAYLVRIDALAAQARPTVQKVGSAQEGALALAAFLFSEIGLQGNHDDYADPRNSFLNDVLDRGLGIPISLSVIYVAVARQLGLPAHGVGLPGHFVVRVRVPRSDLYLDPFYGGIQLTLDDCARRVAESTGYQGPLQPEWLQALSPGATLTRMLNNLKNAYVLQEDWAKAIAVVCHLSDLHPGLPNYYKDLGLLQYRQGHLRVAVRSLEAYLSQVPRARDADQVRETLCFIAGQLAKLN